MTTCCGFLIVRIRDMAAGRDSSGNIDTISFLKNQLEKDNKIQSIFRAAPVGIGMVVNRIITEANDTLCRMTGYSIEEIIGKSARILYPSDEDFEYVGSAKYRQIHEKGNGSVETRWKKKNGEIINIILSSSAVDMNDPSKGVTFTALDISERKSFEDTIRMRDLQLNNIAINVPAALYQYYVKNNGDTGFYYISESSEQIFGIKNNLNDFFDEFASHVSSEYRNDFLKSIEYSVKNKIPWEFVGIFNKEPGGSIWFRCMSNPVILENEVIFNGIGTDITDKVRYLALRDRESRLDSLALLAGGIAHDFNNILGGIFGYIEMARNYSRSDKLVSGYLDNAMQIFDRTKALTGQLLTFGKGGEPVKKCGSISQTLIELTRFLMSGSEHSYEFSFPDDLWMCNFDAEQINNAFENIITNAIQAMPTGGNLYISAENVNIPEREASYLKPGKYVKISVKDSGTGIPGDLIPKIFDPFFTTKNKSKGLGLTTSHSIINRHNGCIDVVSSPGKGTAFYVYIPASEINPEIKSMTITPEHAGKGNILLMDDEVFIRETVGEMLKIMGYNVYKVSEGAEALSTLDEEMKKGVKFTAIILDLTIQNGMGGRETISRIRKMGINTPAFASSGYSDDPVISQPRDFGFTDSLRKPYRMEDLASLLNFYLNENSL
jgi:PAS domain S-box-containing protein